MGRHIVALTDKRKPGAGDAWMPTHAMRWCGVRLLADGTRRELHKRD